MSAEDRDEHLLDPETARVNDPAAMNLITDLVALADRADPYGDEQDDAGADRLTTWSALAILFPWQVREIYLPA
jgi:hypothetical protein